MPLQIKTGGVYKDPQGVYEKYADNYHRVEAVYAKKNGLYQAITTPVPHFDFIAPVGSSTTSYTWNGGQPIETFVDAKHNSRQVLCGRGLETQILYDFAAAGATIENIEAAFDASAAAVGIAGLVAAGKKIAFPINLGSNNIGETTWANRGTTSTTNITSMTNAMTSLVNKIKAIGCTPMIGTCNPRINTFDIYAEWNANFYEPLGNALTPDWWPAGKRPFFDMWQLYKDNRGVANWFVSDGTHPGPVGLLENRRYMADIFRLGTSIPRMVKRNSVIVAGGAQSGPKYLGGVNFLSPAVGTSLSSIRDRRGNVVFGASVVITGGYGSSSRGNPLNYDVGLEHHSIQLGYITKQGDHTIKLSRGPAYAWKTGVVKITYNWNGPANTRVTRYTNGANTTTLDGGGTGVNITQMPFTADANGDVIITCSNVIGGYPSYSGMEFILDGGDGVNL